MRPTPMTFRADLLGRGSHEALVRAQETEILLLENIRKFMQQRAKCEQDYASSLSAACHTGEKLNAEIVDAMPLPCAQVWGEILQMTEELSLMYKSRAEALANHTVNRVNTLIAERKAIKKNYSEERSTLDSKRSQLGDSVSRLQQDYEKALDSYKNAQAKHEDLNNKNKSKKKSDETRDKYRKVTARLHALHNDYSLTIAEAQTYEACTRRTLLPDLMDYQQNVMQCLVEQCKEIMHSYLERTSTTGKDWQDLQSRMECSISSILPREEYVAFLQQNSGVIEEERKFAFDAALLDSFKGKLQPSKVELNDLTADDVKSKESELAGRLLLVGKSIRNKQEQLDKQRVDLSSTKPLVFQADTQMMRQRAIDMLHVDVNSLQCQEECLLSKHTLLQVALDNLGSKDTPSAIEFDDNSSDGSALSQRASSQQEHQYGVFDVQDDSGLLPATRRQDNKNSFVSTLMKTRLHKRSPSTPPDVPSRDFLNSSSTSDYSGSSGEFSPLPPVLLQTQTSSRVLWDEEWFHGVLPRNEVTELLFREGDFLVRETVHHGQPEYVLSVFWECVKHFILQKMPEGHYRCEGASFPSIQELIQWHVASSQPVTKQSSAILRSPIQREKWQLNNDDVELKEKIGKGNFGDVYCATLKTNGRQVAVKTCKATLPDDQKKTFLKEGRILKQYDHPNIVRFIGICTQRQPVMLVMELCAGGSLLSFLKKVGRSLEGVALIAMCIDAAAGMAYLEERNCIHRDLAARNCLLTADNVVKISDFGMSREEEVYTASGGLKQIPVKWTAPEAINFLKYTSASDVWSYGILMWEVFALGIVPYPGMSNNEARDFIEKGKRLTPMNENMPEPVCALMQSCWKADPEKRPHFSEIRLKLQELKKKCFRASKTGTTVAVTT